ncbi:hypothetical protein BUALT_Bualt15G0036200 [Buddleja alternifolia]|uniref:TF-B3 domain-containing protein n=1 Tax=Buddleja alternifolia TaxID=168488 RepID=A0AAV6WN54_9LAMI|nr:hypothetical protein BUALT_Bualt15G0036200 [Buddleja alternifolia]
MRKEMVVLLLPSNEAKVSTTADPHSWPDANSSTLARAQRIQANPSMQYPNFLKQLLKSHLSGKFYLGLPKKFCDAHLPSHDGPIVLVDENENEYNTKYSVRKNRLSGGWRGFSIAHKLLEGDALVFLLIEPCKFRVYMMRSSKLTENDSVIGLQTSDFQNSKPNVSVKTEDQMEENAHIGKTAKRTYLNSLPVDNNQEKKKARSISDSKRQLDQLEGIRCSEYMLHFNDVTGFEDFKIQVDGLILDSEIPTNLRIKYFELCCSQKIFLHDRLIKGLSSKLAVVIISETVEIADAIRSANLSTPLQHLECWEKTLKAFEGLGMAVGFLRDRLLKLVSISRESQANIDPKRIRRAQADGEISIFEGHL